MTRIRDVAYKYTFCGKRVDNRLKWAPAPSKISLLTLGFDWRHPISNYNKRSEFYYGFLVSKNGEEMSPIIDAKIELTKASIDYPQFTFEAAVAVPRLSLEQRDLFNKMLNEFKEDPKFKIWWDDEGGPRKRSAKKKDLLIKTILSLPSYNGEENLSHEDAEVSIRDALKYLEYEPKTDKNQIKKDYKKRIAKLTLKFHPDNQETGNEEQFIYLQKCKVVLDSWV